MLSRAKFPEKLEPLFSPKRFKVLKGGRAGAKSWGIARALLIQGSQRKLRILCTRETQKSIAESVHHLLKEQIGLLGLQEEYTVQETSIKGLNGTEFLFAGIRQQNVVNLKSFEDVDICWVEEAQVVTKRSWEILIPTIRKEHSEIWLSFNPELATDETYKRFVINATPDDYEVITINYTDNPFLSSTASRDIERLKETDPDAFEHIYGGACKQVVEGAIYKEQLIKADKENRITRVPYTEGSPVHTFWDLGFADNVSIWFAQSIGFEFRLIDFLSDCQKDISFYLRELQNKGYVYGTHYLPHDARQKQLAAGGRSIQSQIEAGRKVQIVPDIGIADGIAAARTIFSRCWFDAEKCADGIQALRHYRYETDEKLETLKKQPLHDWASHPADAFRMFAVSINEPKRQQEQVRIQRSYSESGWMA